MCVCYLFASACLVVSSVGFFGNVETQEAFLDAEASSAELGTWSWIHGCRYHVGFHIGSPLGVHNGASPRDENVATTQSLDLLFVSADRHIAHPVGVLGPGIGCGGSLEKERRLRIRCRVDVLRHFVACVEKMHFVEQLILTVPAEATNKSSPAPPSFRSQQQQQQRQQNKKSGKSASSGYASEHVIRPIDYLLLPQNLERGLESKES